VEMLDNTGLSYLRPISSKKRILGGGYAKFFLCGFSEGVSETVGMRRCDSLLSSVQ
jgi:hypothetical protein